jgi:hypothetical protein
VCLGKIVFSHFFYAFPQLESIYLKEKTDSSALYKGSDELNEQLVKNINDSKKIHITPTRVGTRFIIRFAICARTTDENDVVFAWNEISRHANKLLLQ